MFHSTVIRELRSHSIRRALSRIEVLKPAETLELEEEKFSHLLQRCAETSILSHGRAFHAKFVKESLLSSLFLHNHLLNMYAKCGDTAIAVKMFEDMSERNIVSWSAVILGLVQHGFPKKGLSLFSLMHRNGVKPNGFTLVSALNALIRHGKLVEAMELFEKCPVKDIVSWNAMLAGYLQYCYVDVPGFWWKMNHEGMKPDNLSFSTVLTGLAALSDLKMGLQVHAQLVKHGHGDDLCWEFLTERKSSTHSTEML